MARKPCKRLRSAVSTWLARHQARLLSETLPSAGFGPSFPANNNNDNEKLVGVRTVDILTPRINGIVEQFFHGRGQIGNGLTGNKVPHRSGINGADAHLLLKLLLGGGVIGRRWLAETLCCLLSLSSFWLDADNKWRRAP